MPKEKRSKKTVSMDAEQAKLRLVAFAQRIVKGPQGETTTEILRKAHISQCTFSALRKAGVFEKKEGKFIFSGSLQQALGSSDYNEAAAIIRDIVRGYSAELVANQMKKPKPTPQVNLFPIQTEKDLEAERPTKKGIPIESTYKTSNGLHFIELSAKSFAYATAAAQSEGVTLEDWANKAILSAVLEKIRNEI